MKNKKTILIIMDGWGLGKVQSSDALRNAKVPFVSSLYDQYPHTQLITCGEAVGLPEGQMGNSEVGHLNLGAGRIVYQELQRINVAIRSGEFFRNERILAAIQHAKHTKRPLHLIGLVSDGGVHAHLDHLKALTKLCKDNELENVLIHAFTDGRDTDPKSGLGYIRNLQQHLTSTTGQIATVTGRYYAMDRDKRWERVKIAYAALVNGEGTRTVDLEKSILNSYEQGTTDEFLMPMINSSISDSSIREGDAVICFNFRTDRCREITEVLTQRDMEEFGMKKLNLHYCTMTEYDKSFSNVQVAFETDDLKNTLGEILSLNGKSQLRIAETEKYPHVSFFFSGGREAPFKGEQRIMIPSPKVATYDLKPEMSASEVMEAVINNMRKDTPDFICLNFANPDMVGHTGVWEAIIKAVETVDQCVNQVVTEALKHDYMIFLTADHGNADYAKNEDDSPNTAHTLNPVPLFLIDTNWNGALRAGKLADVAPTILKMMGIPIPAEMTGTILTDSPQYVD
jgi:2,3-bisphosphoglycerate-independent phosphoglycerate mutase